MADASWDIVVGVQNKQEIDALNASIEKGEEAIRRHTAVLQMQGAAIQQSDPVFKQYGDSIAAATERVRELTEANAQLAAGVGRGIPGAYGVASQTYDVGDVRGKTHLDGEVEAAVAATQQRNAIRRAMAESETPVVGGAKAVAAARAAGEKAGKAFGGGAAMGLLQLGQAVDDVQYGFRAIVNNIPAIVMGFGGGAGIAGAVGIAAVAVNQLINHWDELHAVLSNTEGWRTAEQGIKALVTALEGAKDSPDVFAAKMALIPGIPGLGAVMKGAKSVARGTEAERKLAVAQAKDRAEGAKLFAQGDAAEVDKQKAADFKAAIEESGGLKAVLERALKEAMKAFDADKSDEKDRAAFEAEQKGRIAKLFAEGMKGGDFNPDAFGADFGKRYDAQEKQRKDKEIEKDSKDKADADKAMDKERTKLLNEQGKLHEDRMWADREDEIEALQDREKKMQRRKQDDGDHKSQIFSGGKALADSLLTSGMNHVAQAQLQEARNLNRKIDALRQDLRNDRKQARLGQ